MKYRRSYLWQFYFSQFHSGDGRFFRNYKRRNGSSPDRQGIKRRYHRIWNRKYYQRFFGCPPTATFSQNVGIVGTTKVISRRVFATSAGILLVAGLIPKFSALLRTIPQCVLGGAVVSVFASIAMTGIRLLVTEKLTARNATVAGLSIAIGMGVSLSGGCLDQMTQSIHSALNLSMNLENFQAIINNTFASSPVVLATIFAVILNLILPKEKTTEKETKLR